MTNIAVFASGTGSNAVNLVKTFNAGSRIRVALCLTDKENAPVIDKMKDLGVETMYFPRSVWKNEPQAILDILHAHDIQLIALAGFLCFLPSEIVADYDGRILNIHPSLLPAYGGRGMHGENVHKAVIEAGDTKSGATVHIVTNDIDAGPIVVQREVEVLPDDTPESLEAKVHEVEYLIFPEAVMKTVASLQSRTQRPDATAGNESVETPESPAISKSVDDAWAETLGVPNNVPPAPKTPNQQSQTPTVNTAAFRQGPIQSPTGAPNSSFRTPHSSMTSEPMPQTYLALSVICTVLFSTIPGVVAIINSAKVSAKYYEGDLEGSRRASRNAEIWIIVSFVLGVLSATLYLPLMIAGGL